MKCPDCLTTLDQFDYRGIQIYTCPNCTGNWFPRNAFNEAKDRTDEDLRWIDFDPFDKRADKFGVPSRGKHCPECLTRMTSLTNEASKVLIDKCARCRGIWVGRGEFEKIVTYLEHIVATESASSLAKDAFRKFLEIGTGTKSKIAEIKDFLVVMKLLEERVAVEHPTLAAVSEKVYEVWPLK